MCGFLGCVVKEKITASVLKNSINLINHRGPDNSDIFFDELENSYLYLGHTRLSIIDLSEGSHQPFHSHCKNYAIIFNGEIYNYKELRSELVCLGYTFKTSSDTEVLLYAFVEWGKESLRKLIGMFSFVFYDKKRQTLTLVRDAFGIKPFFYAIKNNEIYFASELPPLLQLMQGEVKPNLQRAYDYLVHGDYDSNEFSFVEGVMHLPPAGLLTYDLKLCSSSNVEKWWAPNISTNSKISFNDAVLKLQKLFLESVRLHLRSDVPVGVALSGGIDSSAVVSVVRFLEPTMLLNTFSYISSEKDISEEYWVDLLNQKTNSRGHKVFADANEMSGHLDDMLLKQGEPFGSTSIYAQYRVFKLAKECGIKVTLDGQGADELLAGYSGYPGHRLLSLIETGGLWEAHKFAKQWSKYPGRSYFLAWKYLGRIKFPDFIYKYTRKIMGRDFQPKWLDIGYLRKNGVDFKEYRAPLSHNNKGLRLKEALVNSLSKRGLPGLLRHGDRNSMAFSIESRVPFLTIPMAEFLLSLPEDFLLSKDGITKNIFRESMRGIVPDDHLDRKDKIGFETPEYSWLISIKDQIINWIHTSPDIQFINKELLVKEFFEIIEGNKAFDKRVWRWINYLRWVQLFNIRSK